jgi:hypothetical protein
MNDSVVSKLKSLFDLEAAYEKYSDCLVLVSHGIVVRSN